MLRVHELTKHFGGVKAVSNCTFSVQPKTITALIGPNGAGKTTVFNLISGLFSPDHGKVYIGGHEVSGEATHIRAKGLARTFQAVRLFKNLSIEENLLLAFQEKDQNFWHSVLFPGEKDTHQNRLQEVLDLVGLDKPMSTLAADLSYGQTKLLEIARALLKPHQVLLLDEPVAGVNPVLRERLKDVLRKLRDKGETILLVEHDMDFVMTLADWVIVMDIGTVLTEGKPEDVRKNKEVLEAYLGDQV